LKVNWQTVLQDGQGCNNWSHGMDAKENGS